MRRAAALPLFCAAAAAAERRFQLVAPEVYKRSCVDDPQGVLAAAGQDCGTLILGATCNSDLHVLNPALPEGSHLKLFCPSTCNTCDESQSARRAATQSSFFSAIYCIQDYRLCVQVPSAHKSTEYPNQYSCSEQDVACSERTDITFDAPSGNESGHDITGQIREMGPSWFPDPAGYEAKYYWEETTCSHSDRFSLCPPTTDSPSAITASPTTPPPTVPSTPPPTTDAVPDLPDQTIPPGLAVAPADQLPSSASSVGLSFAAAACAVASLFAHHICATVYSM